MGQLNKNLFLGLDIGTSTSKVAIFDIESKKYYSILKEYQLQTPQPGWIEIDAENIWKSILNGITECISKSGFNAKDIAAISFSVLAAAITALDINGRALYPFIEAWDARENGYKKYTDLLFEIFGEYELFKTSGNYLVYSSLNKILWLKDWKNGILKNKIWKFVCVSDYIAYKLTGTPAIDYSMASFLMNFDIRKKDYSENILEKLNLKKENFSSIYEAGQVIGNIKKDVSDYTGLSIKTKIVSGGFDQACSAFGVGNIAEGIISESLGTAEGILSTINKPVTTKNMMKFNIPCNPHVARNKFILWGAHTASGMMLKWYKDILCEEEKAIANKSKKDVYDLITCEASKSPAGSRNILILPHLRGSGLGIRYSLNSFSRSSIIGLNFSHNKNDISRAILEGVVFESRVVMENLESRGIKVREIRVTGGGTKSEFWLQVRANILNKKILIPKFKDAGLLGAIMLSAIGLGAFKSETEASENLVEIEKIIYPDSKETADLYDNLFKTYKKIYTTLLPIYEELRNISVKNL